MKFSKKSWHYKFNRFMTNKCDTEGCLGLCEYFWFTFWNICKALGIFVVLGLIGYIFVTFLVGILFHVFWSAFELSFVLCTFLAGLISLGGFGCWLEGDIKFAPDWVTEPIKKHVGSFSSDKPKPKKQPSLLMQYLKAVKEKVCPTIEWE